VCKVSKAYKDSPIWHPLREDFRVLLPSLGFKDFKDLSDLQELEHKALKALRVLKVYKVLKALKGLKDSRDDRDSQANFRDLVEHKVIKDIRGQAMPAFKDLKVLKPCFKRHKGCFC
jgi:hypothetical protein